MSDVLNRKISQEIIDERKLYTNVKYICGASEIINDALRNGKDVTHLGKGDIITAEQRTVYTHYVWNAESEKMVKLSSTFDDVM